MTGKPGRATGVQTRIVEHVIETGLENIGTVSELCRQFDTTRQSVYRALRQIRQDRISNTVNQMLKERPQELKLKTDLPGGDEVTLTYRPGIKKDGIKTNIHDVAACVDEAADDSTVS